MRVLRKEYRRETSVESLVLGASPPQPRRLRALAPVNETRDNGRQSRHTEMRGSTDDCTHPYKWCGG